MTAESDPGSKITESLRILRASEQDAQALWEWRNDALTRQMSVSEAQVDRQTHETWYRKLLANPDRYLYVGCLETNERIGMCRFDLDTNSGDAEVSINLNPACRGKRLSSPLLAAAMSRFQLERRTDLIAKIKRSNLASIRCFAANGFVLDDSDGELLRYRYHIARGDVLLDPPTSQTLAPAGTQSAERR